MLLGWAISRLTSQAEAGSCCNVRSEAADEAGRRARIAAQSTPHRGQMTAVEGGSVEVAYLPQETRLYLYDAAGKPLSVATVQAKVTMQVQDKWKQIYRFDYMLTHVAAPAGAKDHQDYLVTKVALNTIRDGHMDVEVQLTGLPFHHPQAAFSQVFASSRPRPKVSEVALAKADEADIARQKTCPVSGAVLGSMGDPIKLLVGDKALFYVCCKNCIVRVEDSPETYLAKVARLRPTK
jgi:hypothetical protein